MNLLAITRLTTDVEDEISLFEELWTHFVERYFTIDMGVYENLNFGTGTLISINMIIYGIIIGFFVAGIAVIIDKKHLGDFVRNVVANGCTSPEKAMTLSELEYSGRLSIRTAVRKSTNLRRVLKCREEEEYYSALGEKRAEYEEKRKNDETLPYFNETKYLINTDTDHFYIPEEMRIVAELKFDKKGTTWKGLLLLIPVSILLCAFLIFIIPEMLQMLDNFLGEFNKPL